MSSHDTDSQPTPDEHQRFAHYLQQLAAVREADEPDLVATVLRDPDQTMAQSAVARHLDNRAAHLLPLPDQQFEDWARAIPPEISELDFLTRRLHEWTLLASAGRTRRVRAAAGCVGKTDNPADLIHRP
jgi:hypothetical protein